DESEAARLLAANTDPHPLIISNPSPPPATAIGEKSSPAKELSGQLLRYSANLFVLALDIPGDRGGWLYYSDSWSPYWHALVDGQQVPIYRANVGFKAILVPAGRHEIVWYYHHPRQHRLVQGLFLAGIIFSLVWFGYLLWWWRRAGVR
ncbi:MAG: YfhO family protein, partial [Magnetococcales bacterium]|nr:YfhO family protein [Magnetococcales bacterium]